MVAFDTAFPVSSMAPAAYTYALPPELARQHGLRRYGFHGISYQYLVEAAAEALEIAEPNLVIAHLGGCTAGICRFMDLHAGGGCHQLSVSQVWIMHGGHAYLPWLLTLSCTAQNDTACMHSLTDCRQHTRLVHPPIRQPAACHCYARAVYARRLLLWTLISSQVMAWSLTGAGCSMAAVAQGRYICSCPASENSEHTYLADCCGGLDTPSQVQLGILS